MLFRSIRLRQGRHFASPDQPGYGRVARIRAICQCPGSHSHASRRAGHGLESHASARSLAPDGLPCPATVVCWSHPAAPGWPRTTGECGCRTGGEKNFRQLSPIGSAVFLNTSAESLRPTVCFGCSVRCGRFSVCGVLTVRACGCGRHTSIDDFGRFQSLPDLISPRVLFLLPPEMPYRFHL